MRRQSKVYGAFGLIFVGLVGLFVGSFFVGKTQRLEAWTGTEDPFYQGKVGDYYDDGELNMPNDIATDSLGNYYISNHDNYRIEKYNSAGVFLMNWGSMGSSNGQFQDPRSIVIDSLGYVYIADATDERIQKFDSSGNYISQWGSFGVANGQFSNGNGLYSGGMQMGIDSSDNIYVADVGNARVQKFDTDGTHLMNFTDATLTDPISVEIDENTGNVIIAESTQVNIFNSTGTLLDAWNLSDTCLDMGVDSAGNIFTVTNAPAYIYKYDQAGNLLDIYNDATVEGLGEGDLNNPRGMSIDASDNILVADMINQRYLVFDSAGNYVKKGGSDRLDHDNFYFPLAVSFDHDNNFYVIDAATYRILKYNSSGVYLLTIGDELSFGSTADGEFGIAEGIGVDLDNNLYVADSENNRIQKFDSAGNYLMKFGTYGSGNGEFDYPTDVVVDSSGFIYVVDSYNSRIQKFDSAGNYLDQWGVYGSGNGELDAPYHMVIDNAEEYMYVTDSGNNRIAKFDLDGNFVQNIGAYGAGDVEFVGPKGISIDLNDYLYISDSGNYRTQIIDKDGNYLNELGGACGRDEGEFDSAYGLDFNKNTGELLIVDTFNSRTQKYLFDVIVPEVNMSQISVTPTSGNTRYLKGTATDLLTNISQVEFNLDGTTTWTGCTADDGTFNELSEAFTCSFNNVLTVGGHTFYLRATDSWSNTNTIYHYSFNVAGDDGEGDGDDGDTPIVIRIIQDIIDDLTDEDLEDDMNVNDTVYDETEGEKNEEDLINGNSGGETEEEGLPRKILNFHNKYAPLTLSGFLAFATTLTLITYPYSTMYYGIEWLAGFGKKKAYGLVYNKRTRKPVAFAIIELHREGKMVKRTVANNHGKFLLVADKGEYGVLVKQTGYQEYKETLKISENEHSIVDTFGILENDDNYSTNINRSRRAIKEFAPGLFYIGLTWSVVALFLSFTIFNIVILVIYLVQILILLLNKAPRNWGFVFDVQGRNKLPGILVRAYDPKTDQAVDSQLTDDKGRFGFTLPGKTYELLINSENYKLAKNNKTVEKGGWKYIKYQTDTNYVDRIGLEKVV